MGQHRGLRPIKTEWRREPRRDSGRGFGRRFFSSQHGQVARATASRRRADRIYLLPALAHRIAFASRRRTLASAYAVGPWPSNKYATRERSSVRYHARGLPLFGWLVRSNGVTSGLTRKSQ